MRRWYLEEYRITGAVAFEAENNLSCVSKSSRPAPCDVVWVVSYLADHVMGVCMVCRDAESVASQHELLCE